MALVTIDAKLDGARSARAEINDATHPSRALSTDELARLHYSERLGLDQLIRDAGLPYASISVDPDYVAEVRAVAAGRASYREIRAVFADVLDRYRARGNLVAPEGTPEWGAAVRGIASAELAMLARSIEIDEGASHATLAHPPHLAPPEVVELEEPVPAVSLRSLLEDHLQYLEAGDRGKAARQAWPRIFDDLLTFIADRRGLKGRKRIEADDARRLTPDELIAWRDAKLAVLSSKSVKDKWMASVKSVLRHALEDRKIDIDPSAIVKVRHTPAMRTRDSGYTDAEAVKILKASKDYKPAPSHSPATQESAHISNAKRWAPWLCAFTGARIGEIAQLRKGDVQKDGDIWFIRITPEAGRVKTRAFRDVPLHQQLIELGFLEFVKAAKAGPLFFDADRDPIKSAQVVSGRLSTWLRKADLSPDGVAPNHGWRHRFKTISMDLGADPRVVEAIQGHAGRTAADNYGNVSLKAKWNFIVRIPHYPI